jgi:hypothetical protein
LLDHDLAKSKSKDKTTIRIMTSFGTSFPVERRSLIVHGNNSKLKIKIMIHVQGYIQDYGMAHLPPQRSHLHSDPITRLASDLSRACQKVQFYGKFVSGLRHGDNGNGGEGDDDGNGDGDIKSSGGGNDAAAATDGNDVHDNDGNKTKRSIGWRQ